MQADREQILEGVKPRDSAAERLERVEKDRTSLGSNPTVTANVLSRDIVYERVATQGFFVGSAG